MHRRHVLPRVVLGLVLVLLPTLALAGARALPGKDAGRDARSGAPYLPVAVPCGDAVQDLTLTVSMYETYADSTFGDSAVDAYACEPGWAETGPEHVYILTASEDLIADIWLATNVPNDHDLVLLTDCDSDACLVQANSELSVQMTAGTTVYLVVDGFLGAAGSYELTLETRGFGISESICDGGAVPVAIKAGENRAFDDTLYDRSNLVSVYDCAPYTIRGGETWYELTIAGADTVGDDTIVTVTIAAMTVATDLDLVLWVFDGCGLDAQCLAFVDETDTGGEEVLEWANPDPEPLTVYVAVDCIQRPVDDDAGEYRVELTTASIGVPGSICEGGAEPVELGAGDSADFTDTLFDRANLVSAYECAPGEIIGGGDVWYEMTIAGADTVGDDAVVSVTVLAATASAELDLALWVFDGCGPNAQCLAFVDATIAGGEETLEWSNPDPDDQTVYLAVDCVQPAGDTAAGTFDLDFTAVVAVQAQSMRAVRNIFR